MYKYTLKPEKSRQFVATKSESESDHINLFGTEHQEELSPHPENSDLDAKYEIARQISNDDWQNIQTFSPEVAQDPASAPLSNWNLQDSLGFSQPAPQSENLKNRGSSLKPSSTTTPTSKPFKLGSLSEKYESNGRAGTVSSGKGDKGGVSYGSYQLSSKAGTVSEFIKSSHNKWADQFVGLTPGDPKFSDVWKKIAAKEPEQFAQAQHDFIKETHYQPQVKAIKAKLNLDIEQRSQTLQNVIWSTAVQQRNGTVSIVKAAIGHKDPAKITDEEIISGIYAERGRTRSDGQLVHFHKNSIKVQQGVAKRFANESKQALTELKHEQESQNQYQ